MRFLFSFLLISSLLFFNSCEKNLNDPASFVDPFIGTDAHGHTYPGASMPHGMVQLSPDTRIVNWDACSGYHSSDRTILGFSHTHLSGTGAIDYGDIRFMPTQGPVLLTPGDESAPETGYRSTFKQSSEKAQPGYYAVVLDDYNILAELTVTERVGIHRYKLLKGDTMNLIVDLKEDLGGDYLNDAEMEWVNDTTLQGYRISSGWAKEQHVYFYAVFSSEFKVLELPEEEEKAVNYLVKALQFTPEKGELMIKVGLSAVSIEGARKNLSAEAPHWNFAAYRDTARSLWNQRLSTIEVKGTNPEHKVNFYTALYHSFLAPNLYSDVDGKYRGMDMKIHRSTHPVYTVFSLWDTFRATHPLFTLIDPRLAHDLIKTMMLKYRESGLLPVWELAACETGTMIGYHSIPVIADAYAKGLRDFEIEEAYEAMKKSAMQNHLGLEQYKTEGFIPADKEHEAVAKTLEYAYDDWCIATLAKALDKTDDYREFIERAQFYKNLYDPSTQFMRAKKNGAWVTPFDPYEVSGHYTEANAWQYSYFVPQDINGLIEISGGDSTFETRLDSLFLAQNKVTGREQPDITGLIGQYAHGNEPSHHMAYLYNFIGKPWKTQEITHQIMNELYTTKRDGLCGNEDCGQMSSWFNFSAAGFYPVTPGSDYYVIGTPLFDETKWHLGENTFIIRANNLSHENKYIQSATLNGKQLTRSFLYHEEIIAGGELVFEMQSEPNKNWGLNKSDRPKQEITDFPIVTTPVLLPHEKLFIGSTKLEFEKSGERTIFYSIEETNGKSSEFKQYDPSEPILLGKSAIIKAYQEDKNGNRSRTLEASFHQIPEGMNISLQSEYSHHYAAGGDLALIDGVRGNLDFRSNWQGYQKQDLVALIDLGSEKNISSLSLSCLQDQRIWIMLPQYVEFAAGVDANALKLLGKVEHQEKPQRSGAFIHPFQLDFSTQKARFIQVKVKNFGTLPEWHYGAGGDAWIFADELIIR